MDIQHGEGTRRLGPSAPHPFDPPAHTPNS
jgi:hypothetical protein